MKAYEYELICTGGDNLDMGGFKPFAIVLTQKQFDDWVEYDIANNAAMGLLHWLMRKDIKDGPYRSLFNELYDESSVLAERLYSTNGGPFKSKYDFRSSWEAGRRRKVGAKRWER